MQPIELTSSPDPRLADLLTRGWDRIVRAGGIAYDPTRGRVFRHGQLRYHYIPGRGSRPGSGPASPSPLGVSRPAEPGPFSDPADVLSREILRPARGGRLYHCITNRYPVRDRHFLLVRHWNAPPEILPQCLFGPEEIEDALRFNRQLGPPFRSFFNSNSGADGSSSGSTVNHWHFQLMPHEGGAVERFFAPYRGATDSVPDCARGTLPDWPIPHRLHHGCDLEALARSVWQDVATAIEKDCAFNLELAADHDRHIAAAIFARAPLRPITLPSLGELSPRFGGWELSGDVVIYDEEVFEWVCAHPGEADRIAWQRLRDGTRDIWT